MDFNEALTLYGEAAQKDKFKDNLTAQELYSDVIRICEVCLSYNKIKEGEIKRLLGLSYNNRGHLKYLKVDFDGAVEDYSKAIVNWEPLAVAYYNRGLVHYRLGDFNLGAEDMKQTLKLDPNFHSAKECLDQCNNHLLNK